MHYLNRLVLHKVKLKGEVTSKGEVTRKSPTLSIKKKKKPPDILDPRKLTTNSYNTVAKQQGVNKSVVFKWEKHRSKILAELTLNKTKNTGA